MTTREPIRVVVLNGVNGVRRQGWMISRGLRDSGLPCVVSEFLWSCDRPWRPLFRDLLSTRRQANQADRLAEMLAGDAGRTHLVTHSGGCAVAVRALERLPAGVAVRSLVMLHAGLSPAYDLSPALRRVEFGALSLSSHLDWFMLGFGTTLLGTMDRRHRPAAGMVGFRRRDAAEYAKLRQLRWTPRRAWRDGWTGLHVLAGNPKMTRAVLAPWLREAAAC